MTTQPPDVKLTIPDFRTPRDAALAEPSTDLPPDELRAAYLRNASVPEEIQRLTREFKVSALAGLTPFPDSPHMPGVRKKATLYDAARELGVTG